MGELMNILYNFTRIPSFVLLTSLLAITHSNTSQAQQLDPSRGGYCQCLRAEINKPIGPDFVSLSYQNQWEKCRDALPKHVNERSSAACQKLAGSSSNSDTNQDPEQPAIVAKTKLDDGFRLVGGIRTKTGLSHEFGSKSPTQDEINGADGYIRVRYNVSYEATPSSLAESRTLWNNIIGVISRATTEVNDNFALVLVAKTSHEGKTKLLATAPIFEFKHSVTSKNNNTFNINSGGAYLSPTLKSDTQVELEFKLVRVNDRQLSILFGRYDVEDGDNDLTGVDVIDAIVSKSDIVAVSQTITKNFGPAFEVLTQNEVANINVSGTLHWAADGTSAIQTVIFDNNRSDLLKLKVTVNLEYSESRLADKMAEFVDNNRTIRFPNITGAVSSDNLLNKFKVYDSENNKVLEIDDFLNRRNANLMTNWGRQESSIVNECKSINAIISDFAVPVDQKILFGALLATKSQILLSNWNSGCLKCQDWKIIEKTGIDLSEFPAPECSDIEKPANVVIDFATLESAMSFWTKTFPADPETVRPLLFDVADLSLANTVKYIDPNGILFFPAAGFNNDLGKSTIRNLLTSTYRKPVEHFGCMVRLDAATITEKSNTVHALIKHSDSDLPNQISFVFEGAPKNISKPLIVELILKSEPDQNVLAEMKKKHSTGCGPSEWNNWLTLAAK
jgi:hypothetical protein